jgi:GTPase involved in cell partitioning and DNA repair
MSDTGQSWKQLYRRLSLDIPVTTVIEKQFTLHRSHYLYTSAAISSNMRKYLHQFENATALIFMVDSSDYRRKIPGTEKTYIHKHLQLFDDICNSKYLQSAAKILFLNKVDLTREYLKKTPLTVAFSDFTESSSLKNFDQESLAFLREKFLEKNHDPHQSIYVHETAIVSTENMKHVLQAVRDITFRTASCFIGLV